MKPSTNHSADGQVASAVRKSLPFSVPGRRPDLFASLRLHRRLTLVISAIFLTAGVAALIFGQHEYAAEARLEVSPTLPGVVQGGELPFNSDQQYRDFVQQQVAEIGSYATATAALNLLGKDRSLLQRPSESDRVAAERLVRRLEVAPITNTYLVSISLTGRQPEGLAKIVNAVVNAYLKREQRRENEASDQRAQLLVQHRAAVDQEIKQLRAQESDLARALGVSSFGPNFSSPYDKMLGDANAALDSSRRATIRAQAHLDALNLEEQRAKSLEVESAAEQMVAGDLEANSARQELTKQRESLFVELEQLGPDHPGRPGLEQEMQSIDHELTRLKSDRVDSVTSMLRRRQQTKGQQAISAVQAELDQARLAETGIEQQVADLRTRAASFSSQYSEAVAIVANLVGDTAEIQQTDEQIGLLRIQTQSPGFVSLESPALTPDLALKGKQRELFIIFLLAALTVSTGLPLGLDMIDPLVKTPEELEAIVGFPPFGAVLGSDGRMVREALRRIALGIIRECRTSEIRSFVLTPVSEGMAGHTLALALAHHLNELGIRTATVESKDFTQKLTVSENEAKDGETNKSREVATIRSTRESYLGTSGGHQMASARAPLGLTSLGTQVHPIAAVTSEGDSQKRQKDSKLNRKRAADAMRRSSGYDTAVVADRLSAAPPASSAHLNSTPNDPERDTHEITLTPEPLRGLWDRLHNKYDVILFNAPPILASADAEMLIQLPAAAILVVRSGYDVPRDILAAARRLERATPPIVGTVITYAPAHRASAYAIEYSPRAILRRWRAAR